MDYVKSLRAHYESPTVEAMTKKISSIQALKGLTTATGEAEGGMIPDLHSRYFTADFTYGLIIIQQVTDLAGVKTSNIDTIMDWYKEITLETEEFQFEEFGINDKNSFEKFYLR